MAIVKCGNGHYFDNAKTKKCPHCENGILSEQTINRARQRYLSERTFSRSFDPVTGWLVCVNGRERGRDYRIYSGVNSVGRSIDMTIQIADDENVSRENYCKIIYEPRSNNFYVTPFLGNLVYLNNEPVSETAPLVKDDLVRIGESDFIFIPYCEGRRKWDI